MLFEASDFKSMDFDHLSRAVGGQDALMRHFARIFIENTRTYIADLDVILQVPERGGEVGYGQWRAAVHKIKGVAQTVGAHRLAHLCAKAEDMMPDAALRMDALAAINWEFDHVCGMIADWEAARG